MKPKLILFAALMLLGINAAAKSEFKADKAGVFSYDPKTETVEQTISLSGNLNYIHFFD